MQGHAAHRRREKQIERGVQAVRSGMTYRAAAIKYHIPKSTIWNRMKCSLDSSDKKVGTASSNEEEARIVEVLLL